MSTTQRPTPEVNAHRDEMNRYEFDEELALTYELAKRLECERDEAREQLEAMREAIKEAYDALCRYDVEDVDLVESEEMTITVTAEDQKTLRQSLAKLQPFLKP